MKVYLFKIYVFLSLLLLVAACATKQQEPLLEPAPEPARPPIETALSPLPIAEVSELDIRYVQAALNQLGFNAGPIDGVWGPLSTRAIRLFESAYQLASADGYISELNLSKLTEISTIKREAIVAPTPAPVTQLQTYGLQSKLTDRPLSDIPQLIVTDEDYTILSKPNPFSQIVEQLPAGTGIYIIDLTDGWYQIETLDRKIGYIQK